ncbi:MAG: ketol-acid reductoisomerase [Anaerolineae bacterium]|nr:ketol-acid reductoisomerase [Anaerolineae bacterium]
MTVIYYDADANPLALEGQSIAVIGYGNAGRAFAHNLRDSGHAPVIGNIEDMYSSFARDEGFEVVPIAEAAKAMIKLLLLPDEVMPEVYLNHISPALKQNDALVFASSYNVAFGFIEPPAFVDVMLIAPRASAVAMRERYLERTGTPSFLAVSQDATGAAWDRLLALAQAVGGLRSGAMELTFRQEAELDLFTQQTIIPAIHNLLFTAADVLIREGYPAEAALLDLYLSGELSKSLETAGEIGLVDSLKFLSPTAQYGVLSRLERFNEPKVRRQMEQALQEIREGKFAQEWASEYASGYVRLDAIRQRRRKSPLWEAEQQTLETFRGE